MFTAIILIGAFGSSTVGGFTSADEARTWGQQQIDRGVYGDRKDLKVEVEDKDGRPVRTLAELRNVRVGDMSAEEQRLVVKNATSRIERELSSPAVQSFLEAALR